MARAQLVALACAGLLLGAPQPLGAPELHPELHPALGPGLDCWSDAARDVRARLELVMSVGDTVGDPRAFAPGSVRPPQARPGWLDCFD